MSPGPDTQAGPEAQKVFICYRREDTAAYAGRLYDAMVARFGESNVFMDVDIAPGVDFVERITEVVSRCLVLIVVMGPRWATVEDEDGQPRIHDADDFVRLEVETALRRSDVTPIPALVAGARMPKREALPEPLQPLTRRNALELSDGRWAYDVGRLNSTLDVLLGETDSAREASSEPYPTPMPLSPPTPAPTPAPTPTPTPAPPPATPSLASPGAMNWRLVLEGTLVAGVAAFAGRLLATAHELSEEDNAHAIARVMLNRGVTWALVGAALAVWLGIRTKRKDLVRLGLIGVLVGALAGALGGAIWGARVYLPAEEIGAISHKANQIQIVALAVTGGIVGALIGGLWRASRRGVGLATGIAAGTVLQLIVNLFAWNSTSQPGIELDFALSAAAIVGAVLTALLALDRQASETGARVSVSAAEP